MLINIFILLGMFVLLLFLIGVVINIISNGEAYNAYEKEFKDAKLKDIHKNVLKETPTNIRYLFQIFLIGFNWSGIILGYFLSGYFIKSIYKNIVYKNRSV